MADEEEPINPSVLRDRRRRRHNSASTSEEAKNAASVSGILAPISRKEPFNQEDNQQNGEVFVDRESSMRKKRLPRRHTPEPEMSADSKENIGVGRSDRRKPRRVQNTQRMPRSVSEEVLALEGKFQASVDQDNAGRPPQGKRSRRSRRRGDPDQPHQGPTDDLLEDQNGGSVDNQAPDRPQVRPRPRPSQPRKKRKARSAMLMSGDEENYQGDMDGEVSEIFKIDKEDIIQNDLNQSTGKMIGVNQVTLPSQPLDFLFIEKKDGHGFLKEHKSKLERVNEEPSDLAQNDLAEEERQLTSMEFALQVHNFYQTIALICHGLLAGVAMTQCIFVYSLSESSYRNFLQNYYKLAQPFQSVYYFLLAICVVSVFDRYVNVGLGWSQFFLTLLNRPSRALAIVGYLFALIFSVSLAQLDDKIRLFKDSPQLWSSTSQLSTWRVINLLRVIGAILGWVAVSMKPLDDQAANNLNAAIEQERAEPISTSHVKSGTLASWEHDVP